MIPILSEILEPFRWAVFKIVMRPRFASKKQGRCTIFAGEDFISRADLGFEMIQKADSGLWCEILNTRFDVIEESEEGSYWSTSRKRFTAYRYIVDGDIETTACALVSCFMMSKEVDGWTWWQRYVSHPPLVSSIEKSIEWMEEHGFENAASCHLKRYLGVE